MQNITRIPLTSSEIAGIWDSFMVDSLAVCVLKYFTNRVDDNETRVILQYSLDLPTQHIKELTNFLYEAELPLPEAFSDKDVNINAPRLFSDEFYLSYLTNMSRAQMLNNTQILSNCARKDLRDYFTKLINESSDLYNKVADVSLSKGIFTKTPCVEVPKKVEYIKDEGFIVDSFGKKRSMLTGEITQISIEILSSIFGEALTTGFGQVSRTKEITDYMFKGKNITAKKIDLLSSLFAGEDIPIPSSSFLAVTDSTIAPFSEKLMMFQVASTGAVCIANIGIALAESLRSDIHATFLQMLTQALNYSKDGADIMIANGWLEQPPQAIRHEHLVGV
jgi:hypothetical protein